MKKLAQAFIVLTLVSFTRFCFGMEEQDNQREKEIERIAECSETSNEFLCDINYLPAELLGEILSFEINVDDLMNAIVKKNFEFIKTFFKRYCALRAFNKQWTLSFPCLAARLTEEPEKFFYTFGEAVFPPFFLREISALIIKELKKSHPYIIPPEKADTFIPLIIQFYDKLNLENLQDQNKGAQYFNNFVPEARTLLADCMGNYLVKHAKESTINADTNFVWNLVATADLKWLSELNRSLSNQRTAFKEGSAPFKTLGQIIKDIEYRFYSDAIETLRSKKSSCKKSEYNEVHAAWAKRIVDSVNSSLKLEKELKQEIKSLSTEDRYAIIDTIWHDYLNIEKPLINYAFLLPDLFKLLYPEEEAKIECMSNLLEKIIQQYPKSFAIYYIKSGACFSFEFIKLLYDEVFEHFKSKMLGLFTSDNEAVHVEIMSELAEVKRRFGFRLVIDLCEQVLYKAVSFKKGNEQLKQNAIDNFEKVAGEMKEMHGFSELAKLILKELKKIEDRKDALNIYQSIRCSFANFIISYC